MEIAPGIRRIGSTKVNVYLIEDAGGITVIDAGLPGHWTDLTTEILIFSFETVPAPYIGAFPLPRPAVT